MKGLSLALSLTGAAGAPANLLIGAPTAYPGTTVTDLGGGAYRISGNPGFGYWTISTDIGSDYRMSCTIDEDGATFWGMRKSDDVPSTTNVVNTSNSSSTGPGTADFTATATTTYIVLQANDGNSVDFSNLSLIAL